MKEYADNEINNKFGRTGFFSGASHRLFELNFIGGEEFLEKNKEKGVGGTKLEILKDGSLEINTGSYKTSAVLNKNNLIFITIEKQDVVSQKKNKSVIGRAVLGGLLLGPLGAVVGGMTGIGEKEVKQKRLADYLVAFKIIDDISNKEKILLFGCKSKNYSRVENYLSKYFKEAIKKPEDIIETFEKKQIQSGSRVDELFKLKNLLIEGFLTKEEFEVEKQKIINRNDN